MNIDETEMDKKGCFYVLITVYCIYLQYLYDIRLEKEKIINTWL